MSKIHLKLPHVDADMIESKAQDIILEAAKGLVPTEEVVSEAVDKLVPWLDEQLSYGDGIVARFVDAHDQDLIRWLLHMLVHRIYVELVAADAFTE